MNQVSSPLSRRCWLACWEEWKVIFQLDSEREKKMFPKAIRSDTSCTGPDRSLRFIWLINLKSIESIEAFRWVLFYSSPARPGQRRRHADEHFWFAGCPTSERTNENDDECNNERIDWIDGGFNLIRVKILIMTAIDWQTDQPNPIQLNSTQSSPSLIALEISKWNEFTKNMYRSSTEA